MFFILFMCQMPYDDLFGEKGWCNAEKPIATCPCRLDGFLGHTCDVAVEHNCANQCKWVVF